MKRIFFFLSIKSKILVTMEIFTLLDIIKLDRVEYSLNKYLRIIFVPCTNIRLMNNVRSVFAKQIFVSFTNIRLTNIRSTNNIRMNIRLTNKIFVKRILFTNIFVRVLSIL